MAHGNASNLQRELVGDRAPDAGADRHSVALPKAVDPHGPAVAAHPSGSHRAARVVSLASLGVALCVLGYIVSVAYHALRDAFVAPMILTPESELVIQSRMELERLLAQRRSLELKLEDSRLAIENAEYSESKLQSLRSLAQNALNWSDTITADKAASSTRDLQVLAAQKSVLERTLEQQQAEVDRVRRNVEGGVAHRTELTQAQEDLQRMQLARLQNERERLGAATALRESALAQQARKSLSRGGALVTPEMIEQQSQLVKIELELLEVEHDKRGATSRLQSDRDELAKLDALIVQLRARPTFQAIEGKQNLAFVPYTQLDAVAPNAPVYACAIWGVFACRRVGRVISVLPGEVAMQDPWGTPSRGQYAVLDLQDTRAAKAKTLRVRP